MPGDGAEEYLTRAVGGHDFPCRQALVLVRYLIRYLIRHLEWYLIRYQVRPVIQ